MTILSRGQRFGVWYVQESGSFKSTDKVRCLCMCTTERRVQVHSLATGHSTSCGCVAATIKKAKEIATFGESYSRFGHGPFPSYFAEITSLYQAIERCHGKGHKDYKGRGIKVCNEWREDSWRFLREMGARPTKLHTLDRVNVDGDYELGNCRWATKKEQSNNRRDNVMVTVGAATMTIYEAMEKTGKGYSTLYRLSRLQK